MKKELYLILTLLMTTLLLTAPPSFALEQLPSPGRDLRDTQDLIERRRVQQRIDEGRRSRGVDAPASADEKAPGSALRFQLNEVTTDESSVLTPEALQRITGPYIGSTVTVQDLYDIVSKINAWYGAHGWFTCRAFLPAQTIRGGVVHITLIEGKTGSVTLNGARHTRKKYVRGRLRLKEDEIANLKELNNDVLRFNATNDAQLRLRLQAGETPGTTDYVLTLEEPKQITLGIFGDNAGSKNSGQYRGGFYVQNRSLFGSRDALYVQGVFSEGTTSGALNYTFPFNRHGMQATVGYSANAVRIVDGALEPLGVKGKAQEFDFSLTNPIITKETLRTTAGLDYRYQHSKTAFADVPWVNDTVQTLSAWYEHINYGASSVVYWKQAYTTGWSDDIEKERDRFGYWSGSFLWQKSYRHGQNWTLRSAMQLSSSNYLPSVEQFTIGGLHTVRGYKERLLSGDGGISGTLEYSLPMPNARESVNAYFFVDAGSVWGASAFDDHILAGAGFGVKANVNGFVTLNACLAFPLIRTLNEERQDDARFHFSLTSRL